MKRLLAIALLSSSLVGCSALGLDPGAEYSYVDPETGETVTTTVGDAVADQIEGAGAVVSNIAGKALGVATGNPVVGVSMAALLAALVGTGTSRLRRKKKGIGTGAETTTSSAEPE